MIKVSVFAMPVRNLAGTSTKTGKAYDMNIQTIYCHTVDESGNPLPVPEKCELVLEKGQAAYQPGTYTLSPASLSVDRNGRLAVAPKLVPVPAK